jgi:uncharacterized lipoprotein YddW (UPF0748 family)
MIKKLLLSLLVIVSTYVHAQTPPKREMRGVWVATFQNLDWPSSVNPSLQRSDFTNKMQIMRETNLNAVFVQVRSECDAIYPSTLEPWSAVLSGTQGVAPSPAYDPLLYMIGECRNRGLEFHAWFNPFRAINNFNNIGSFAANHIAKLKPEWLLAQENLRILDPGIPAVRDYVIDVVLDVVRRYDIDGVHLDDYFYPYPPANPANVFIDDATYNADPRGFPNTTAGRANWRRDNINIFVRRLYDSIKTVKPWVKFGISPFGIWRNQSSDPNGSATNGLQSYSDIYADSRAWIQNGWVDYLTPQLYWSIGFAPANYSVLIPWWNGNANGRHIYSGQAAYKIANNSDLNWNNPSQINNQIRLNRTYSNIYGSCFFRITNLMTNPLFVRDSLVQYVYNSKTALLPVMPWRDNTPPQPVTNLTTTVNGINITLNWTAPSNNVPELDKIRHFVIYRSNTLPIDINNVSNILFKTSTPDFTNFIDQVSSGFIYYYTVTALDRFNNESILSNIAQADLTTTSVLSPELRALNLKAYPNPLRTTAQISFELLKPMQVSIKLYDVNGKEVMDVLNKNLFAGKQLVAVNATFLTAGTYYAAFKTKEFTKTIRLSIVK